jgi:hypothetical protein
MTRIKGFTDKITDILSDGEQESTIRRLKRRLGTFADRLCKIDTYPFVSISLNKVPAPHEQNSQFENDPPAGTPKTPDIINGI